MRRFNCKLLGQIIQEGTAAMASWKEEPPPEWESSAQKSEGEVVWQVGASTWKTALFVWCGDLGSRGDHRDLRLHQVQPVLGDRGKQTGLLKAHWMFMNSYECIFRYCLF